LPLLFPSLKRAPKLSRRTVFFPFTDPCGWTFCLPRKKRSRRDGHSREGRGEHTRLERGTHVTDTRSVRNITRSPTHRGFESPFPPPPERAQRRVLPFPFSFHQKKMMMGPEFIPSMCFVLQISSGDGLLLPYLSPSLHVAERQELPLPACFLICTDTRSDLRIFLCPLHKPRRVTLVYVLSPSLPEEYRGIEPASFLLSPFFRNIGLNPSPPSPFNSRPHGSS